MRNVFSINNLKKIALFAILLLAIFQIASALYFDNFQLSNDQQAYINIAKKCLTQNKWYPFEIENVGYVFAPAYVNLLILYHKIFNTFSGFAFVNIVLSFAILGEVYLITKKLFSQKAALISVILYCATYSNWFVHIGFFTELPFMFCMMSAVAICVCAEKLRWYFLAGVLIALGNWVRPLAVAFFVGILIFIFFRKKFVLRRCFALLASVILTVSVIGGIAKYNCGLFVFQSTTSGVNLAGTANGKANGLVGFNYINDSFYKENLPANYNQLDFVQRDKALRKVAIKWILENPMKYIATIPAKCAVFFGFDTWSERFQLKDGLSAIRDGKNKTNLVLYCVKLFFKSLVFYAVMMLTLYYIWQNRHQLFTCKNAILLIAFFVAGLTLPFMITDRYHYPMMPILWIFASQGMLLLLQKQEAEG